MTDDYIKKLIELAKEVHEIQLQESREKLDDQLKVIPVSSNTVKLIAKINYLIGYIMALEQPN